MRMVFGRGKRRQSIEFPTGPKVWGQDNTDEAVALMEASGVKFFGK